jgi:magnesium-transporting ATPase (P-type)
VQITRWSIVREEGKFALVAAMLMVLAGLAWLLPMHFLVDGESVIAVLLASLLSAVITAFSALFISHEHRNAKDGYPLADERSRTMLLQTGNYAFFICAAITLAFFAYSLSGSAWFGHQEVQAPEILFAVMIIMVSVYLGVWALLTFKGRVE